MAYREQISVGEFSGRMKAQGVSSSDHCAFICPNCGTIQSTHSFIAAGVDRERAEKAIAFSCIGRLVDGQGCDWTLGGLFKIHELTVITDDGAEHPRFRFASAEDAMRLEKTP